MNRGFSWGRRPAISADHWTTNDLKLAGHKFITIYFFLSEIIFREKMVSVSKNDRFDNDKNFFNNDNDNIWHFSIITGINYVSICFRIYLKDTGKNFVVNIWTICNAVCNIIYVSRTSRTFWMKETARHEQYKNFKWKRMRVANITKVLNERECLSRT